MRRRPVRAIAVLVLLASVSALAAFAVDAAARRAAAVDYVEVRAGSLGRERSSSPVRLPIRADMLGVTWSGAADEVRLRARGADGRWSRWVELHADPAHAPDRGSAEARSSQRRRGGAQVRASEPVWVGDAEQVQVRSTGRAARDVRIVAINATATATASERAATRLRSSAARVLGAAEPAAQAMPVNPGVRSRQLWGAATPRTEPALASDTGVLGVVVHHTAETNGYACSQVPALLRGIQRYHMRTQGWNDIGYNFLIDRCGGVWEGRAGGTTRPVIGAHSAGFNTSTSGIALMGTHSSLRPTWRARQALERLVAWRLDIAHVKPTGRMALTARTGDKYPTGSRVVVRAVSGHRDVFPTSCPGSVLYRDLNMVASRAWRTGGAKVANVTRSFVLANPADPLDPSVRLVRTRAVASHADMRLALRLQRISTGEVLHQATTRGIVISSYWVPPAGVRVPAWDLRLIVGGSRDIVRHRRVVRRAWRRVPGGWRRVTRVAYVRTGARSVQRARNATFDLLPVGPDPGFVVTTPPAASVAPGGDPADDLVRLQYTLAQDYRLGAWLHDPATGAQVATLREPAYVGGTTTPATLELAIPPQLADGTYELRVGLPADEAVGRSMRRYSLLVARQ